MYSGLKCMQSGYNEEFVVLWSCLGLLLYYCFYHLISTTDVSINGISGRVYNGGT